MTLDITEKDRTCAHAAPGISAEIPDWTREARSHYWDQGRQLLKCIRGYQRWHGSAGFLGRVLCSWYVMRHRIWWALSGAEIHVNCRIGGGLLLPHPNGIVIHPDVELGPNCLIFQQVTIGTGGKIPGVPRIGGHVDIGAGAKILGGITVGDHAKIGANAVVLLDVPPGATAVGVPARIIAR